jgi:MFS family permease
MLVAPFAGRFTDKIGGRWILFAGTLLTALGIYLMAHLSGVTDWINLVLPLVVCGLGMGLVMAPTTTVVMASTPLKQSGMGAGILSTTRQIGSVLGLSVLGAVLQNQLVNNVSQSLAEIPLIPTNTKAQIVSGLQSGGIGAGGINLASDIPEAIKAQMISLFKDQFAHSLDTTMKVAIIVVLCGTVASLLISGSLRSARENQKTKVQNIGA